MKKRFFISILTFCIACILCVSAVATETNDTRAIAYNLLAVSVSDMETNALSCGVGDKVRIRIFAVGETLATDTITLQYNKNAFSYTAVTGETYDGKLSVVARNNANGSVTLSCTPSAPGIFTGSVLLATVYFDSIADASQTAYTFSLTDGTNALSSPVTVQVSHRHSFSEWELVSVSADGTMQTQKRKCMQCDAEEKRTVPYVDYSISLKAGAKNIRFDLQNKTLYQIAPGTTVGTLLDNLTSAGNIQIVDKDWQGQSRNTVVKTGMIALVMDEGDLESTVQYMADISVWGDADGSGAVEATDARIALRYSVGLENDLTDMQILAMDSDSNKEVTAADARFLLRVSVDLDAFYNVPVTNVVMNKTQIELTVGQSEKLTAAIMPSDASLKGLKWSSSNSAVASVSNGTVVAKKTGTTIITASASSGAKATCTVTVINPVRSVTNKRTNCYLAENGTIDLNEYYTITPADADTTSSVWTSTNSAFTVTNGIVKCTKAYSSLSNKSTVITCKFPGGKTTTFKVTLVSVESTYCLFSYESLQVKPGQQFKLSGKISASATLKLATSDSSVLEVDRSNNVFTAKTVGVATVICEGVDYSETVTVYVMNEDIRILGCNVNRNDYDLTIAANNAGTQTITRAEFYISAIDADGETLPEVVRSVKDIPAVEGVHSYRWKDVWSQAVTSAKITKIVVTFADGHTEEIPAGCWYTTE